MRLWLKRAALFLLAGLVLLGTAMPAAADETQTQRDWKVTFTDKLESNFTSAQINEIIRGMQPGDKTSFTVKLINRNVQSTDWYMANKVLNSLEDGSDVAKGGAYTYKLTYKNPAGTSNTLFDSDTVGGDKTPGDNEGLHQATDALKDYFYLDTLATGQTGSITLEIALDGETQGDNYQNTAADVQMQFAVELASSGGNRTQVVKTGDETNLTPLYILMLLSGGALLGVCLYSLRKNRKQRGRKQK